MKMRYPTRILFVACLLGIARAEPSLDIRAEGDGLIVEVADEPALEEGTPRLSCRS